MLNDKVVVDFVDFCVKMLGGLEAASYELDTLSGRRFRIKLYKDRNDIVLRVREDDWNAFEKEEDHRVSKEIRKVTA